MGNSSSDRTLNMSVRTAKSQVSLPSLSMIGIICTMLNGFGARGLYNSQEIGLGKAIAKLTGQKVVIYKAVRKEDVQDTESINDNVTVKYIRCTRIGNAHGYMNIKWLDTEWHGEKMNALICFCDQQIFIPHISRFCRKNGIQMLLYTGIIRSNRGGINALISDILFRLGTKRLYRKLPVVAKTRGVAGELSAIGAGHVPVAPVGIDFHSMYENWRAENRDQIRKDFGYEPDDIVILCISRMEKEKNIMDLIPLAEQCRQNKKIKFFVIGTGRQEEEFKQVVIERHLKERFQIVDKIPHADIWKAYIAADYFANVCRDEIFGMAIMESVYYETPVVAIHAYGPDTILNDMKGSVAVSNTDQMAEVLLDTLPSPEILRQDANAIQKFTWEHTAKIMINAIDLPLDSTELEE